VRVCVRARPVYVCMCVYAFDCAFLYASVADSYLWNACIGLEGKVLAAWVDGHRGHLRSAPQKVDANAVAMQPLQCKEWMWMLVCD